MQSDMFGNNIEPGDYISYPGRSGSSLFVNLAVVLKLMDNGKIQVVIPVVKFIRGEDCGIRIIESSNRKTMIQVLERVTVIPDLYIESERIMDDLADKEFNNILINVKHRIMNGDYV